MKREIIWVALAAFITTWAISSLWWPFGVDQGIFAWAGEVIINGGMPYQDAWEVKGPLIHYIYAFTQLLFGRTMWGIRVFDLLLLAVSLLFLWRLATRLYGNLAARLTVSLFILWYASTGFWSTAQPDGWVAMLMIIAVAYLIDDKLSTRNAVISGVLIGLCALIKPPYAAYLLLFVTFAAFHWSTTPSRRQLIQSIVAASLACGVVVALAISWFAYKGALNDLIDIQLVFNGNVHRQAHASSFGELANFTLGFFSQFWILIAIIPAIVGLKILWQRHRDVAAVIVMWAMLSIAIVVAQDKFYLHHWLPLFVPLALAAGGGLAALLTDQQQLKDIAFIRGHWITTATVTLTFVFALLIPAHSLMRWSMSLNGYISWDEYYTGFGHYNLGDFSFKANQEAAQYVAQRSDPQDSVLVWGFDVMVNYLSGRSSPSRFGYNYPLVRGSENVFEPAYRAEFMQNLQANPPRYILILDEDKNDLLKKTSREYVNDFPEFKDYLNTEYQLETTIEHFSIWRLQSTAVSSRSSK